MMCSSNQRRNEDIMMDEDKTQWDEDNTQWDIGGWMTHETPPPRISCDCSQMFDHTGHTENETWDMFGVLNSAKKLEDNECAMRADVTDRDTTLVIIMIPMTRWSRVFYKKKKKVPQCGTFLVPVWMGREWLRISNLFPPKTCSQLKSSDIFEAFHLRSKSTKVCTYKDFCVTLCKQ